MSTEKSAGSGAGGAGQWVGMAKWGIIGVIAITFMFLFQDEVKKLLIDTEELSITTEGVKLKVKTVSTPLGETVLSAHAAASAGDGGMSTVPENGAESAPSAGTAARPGFTRYTDPNYGYSIAWPAGGDWIKDDFTAAQIGVALFIRFHQSFGNFTPNVNVTIEETGNISIGHWMQAAVPLLEQMGWQVVNVQMDESINAGVRVMKNPNMPGGLFQIQRVILKNGYAYVATASKLESDSGAFPEMYRRMGEILNSFSAP